MNEHLYFSLLEEFLRKIVKVPLEEIEFLRSISRLVIAKKGKILVQEGYICRNIYFVIKGGLRLYYEDAACNEITHNFFFEQTCATAFSSFFTQTKSTENLVSLEDSILFGLSYDNVFILTNRHVAWQMVFNKAIIAYMLAKAEKEQMLLIEDHCSRFKHIQNSYPGIFGRVPQKHIASYLNMTPETFSRIKRKLFNGVK